MRSTEKIIVEIFNDNNIDKNERYMLLMFIANEIESKSYNAMSLKVIMNNFENKNRNKVLEILKSLERKNYIKIIKEAGKNNKYKVINYSFYQENNDEKILNTCVYGDTSIQENTGTGVYGDTSTGICGDTSIQENTSTCIYEDTGTSNYVNTSSYTDTGRGICVNTSTSNHTNTTLDRSIVEKSQKNLENTSFTGDVISLEQKRSLYNNINNNIYINNNKLYINIFNTWNKTSISTEKILSHEIKRAIYSSLEVYGEEKIIKAIENYGEVFYSNHYYNYRWNLLNFLNKPNGAKRFMESGDMWLDYKSRKQDTDDNFDDDFDIQQYIDY